MHRHIHFLWEMIKMRKVGLFIFLAAGFLLGLPGCSSSVNGTSQISTRSEKSTFTAKTMTQETELIIEPSMAFHTLSIRRIKLTAGQLTLTLVGPDESVAWEQTYVAPADVRRDLTPDSLTGKWILRIEVSEASGSYDLVWRAGNTP
jgi:hypothetical protein